MTAIVRAVLLLLLAFAPLHAAWAKDTLTVALQLEPANLDPTSGADAATDEVAYATIFEGLVRADSTGAIVPLLARRWTISPDGRTYVFALRPGVRFHDGTPLTADDVVFSLTRAIVPSSTNAQRQALSVIRRVVALDPLTVRIDLTEPDYGFLTLLSLGDAVIVSSRAAAQLATHPVGTGPFRLVGWHRGDSISLARNEAYWGRPPRLARIRFRFVPDPTAAFAAVSAHDVDIFPDFPAPEILSRIRRDPSLKLVVGPSEGQVIVAINERTGPLAKLAVRRAIAYGIDRRAVIDGAMYGYGTPIGSHFAPQSPDYVDLTGRYPHDPAAARRLLAEAGYPHGFAVTLTLPPQSYARRTGEIVMAQLAQIGIHVTIRTVEWAQWLDRVFARHDYDLTIVDHAEPFDYDIYGRHDYYFGYESPAVRALLARLKGEANPAARHALLGDIQRRIADDAVNAFLFEYPHLGVQDARLTDVWANTPNQTLDFTTAHFTGGGGDDGPSGDVASHLGRVRTVLAVAAGALLLAAGWFLGPRYVAGRLAVLAATMLAATLLIFVLLQVVPGDPAAFMMGLNASPRAIEALHAELGLDRSLPARYFDWIAGVVRGDFGTSYTYRVPVAGLLADRLALSLPLAILATLLSLAIALPMAVAGVRWRGGTLDIALSWLARAGIAIPSFWLGMLLVLLFSIELPWTTSGGFPGWAAGIGPALAALALPAIALAVPQAAILARVARAALVDAMAQDYIRTARAKGLSRGAVLRRHALPNALRPILTVLGLQVPFLLAGSVIVENVFTLPGLGRLALQAIAQRDLIVVQGVVVVMVGLTVAASFLVDLGYALVDPRLRDAAGAR